jgi:translation initiation factor 2 subunit 3
MFTHSTFEYGIIAIFNMSFGLLPSCKKLIISSISIIIYYLHQSLLIMTDLNINEIMNNQPTINIGMIGSVSDGKSTIVKILTSTDTQRHSSEKKHNKTENLGYANAKIFQCLSCPKPECFQSWSSDVYGPKCQICKGDMILRKHVSFVDVPGHNSLMAKMLNGTCVMDSTIIVEAANNPEIPAPQTTEHLFAAKIMNLHNKIVCMNKMDLMTKHKATKKIHEFQKYLHDNDTIAKNSFMIPIAANYHINKDVLCEYITMLDDPKRNYDVETKMIIVRSFEINKPNTKIHEINGGVVGGTIMEGVLRIGDKVEIFPGLIQRNQNHTKGQPRWFYKPLKSIVKNIRTEKNDLQLAIPGGLVGVQLTLDPGLTTRDGLVGNIMRVLTSNEPVQYHIFEVIRITTELFKNNEYKITTNDRLVVNHNAMDVNCTVAKTRGNKTELTLDSPICTRLNETITISKNDGQNITLVCRGCIVEGDASGLLSL